MKKNNVLTETVKDVVPIEVIQSKIFLIRGRKVMLDRDLAELYNVLTRQLNRQVRRNIERFPDDFLMELTQKELKDLKCQFGTSSWGGSRKPPMVFTELGIAMLSSVLNSPRAIQVNIQIMRIFTRLREIMISHKDLARKMEDLESKFTEHDEKFVLVFEAIRELLEKHEEPPKPKGPMGFYIRKD